MSHHAPASWSAAVLCRFLPACLCAVLLGCITAAPEPVDAWDNDAHVPTGHTWQTHPLILDDPYAVDLPPWALDILDGEPPEDYRLGPSLHRSPVPTPNH